MNSTFGSVGIVLFMAVVLSTAIEYDSYQSRRSTYYTPTRSPVKHVNQYRNNNYQQQQSQHHQRLPSNYPVTDDTYFRGNQEPSPERIKGNNGQYVASTQKFKIENFRGSSQEVTTKAPKSPEEIRLDQLERCVTDWMNQMEEKESQNFEKMMQFLNKKFPSTEAYLKERARGYLVSQKHSDDPPLLCKDSILAIDTLLETMKEDMTGISSSLHTADLKANQGGRKLQKNPEDSLPAPSSILAYLIPLEERLDAMGVEIGTETSVTCTLPLSQKVTDLKSKLVEVRQRELARLRKLVVTNSVEGISSGQFSNINLELDDLGDRIGSNEVDGVLQEILNKTMGRQGFENQIFENILAFLKTVQSHYKKIGMNVLIDAMTMTSPATVGEQGKVDPLKFLRLAYEAKNAFGDELKGRFPTNFQMLIWGGTKQCIQNRRTRQFLVSLNSTGQQQSEKKQTVAHRFPVFTAHNSSGNAIRGGFCSWDFYPVVDPTSSSFQFIIRQEIMADIGLNLNVDGGKTYVSPAIVNPNFMWQIMPMDQGRSFSLRAIHPDYVNRNETISNFLCSGQTGLKESAVVIDRFGEKCSWLLPSEAAE